MRIRRVRINRFRSLRQLQFCPGPSTIILGPNNSGKSTVLEALDLLFHPGITYKRNNAQMSIMEGSYRASLSCSGGSVDDRQANPLAVFVEYFFHLVERHLTTIHGAL